MHQHRTLADILGTHKSNLRLLIRSGAITLGGYKKAKSMDCSTARPENE